MDVTWRKSIYSGGNGGNCIEAGTAAGTGRVLIRDAKDTTGPVLAVTTRAWQQFTGQLKAGVSTTTAGCDDVRRGCVI
jgi:hypothetical protein